MHRPVWFFAFLIFALTLGGCDALIAYFILPTEGSSRLVKAKPVMKQDIRLRPVVDQIA